MKHKLVAWSVLAIVGLCAGQTLAHPVSPPVPIEQPAAEWPADHVLQHDLVIPVVLVVAADGSVESASVEAGVGEPFDSIAVRTALRWRFEPARDAEGPVPAKIRGIVRFVGIPAAAAAPREDQAAPVVQ